MKISYIKVKIVLDIIYIYKLFKIDFDYIIYIY